MSFSADVVIHCDGACSGNPGPGGFGAWLKAASGAEREVVGGEMDTTNNRMEMRALLESLRAITRPSKIEVVSDSKYVINGMEDWHKGWIARGWKNVKNDDIWKELLVAAAPHQIQYRWVKGHNGHPGNERADALAGEGVQLALQAKGPTLLLRHPVAPVPTPSAPKLR